MGLFGRKGAEEKEEKPLQSRVRVLNSDGKVLFEKVVLTDSLEWGDFYVEMEMPDEKHAVILPGQNLVIMEDL